MDEKEFAEPEKIPSHTDTRRPLSYVACLRSHTGTYETAIYRGQVFSKRLHHNVVEEPEMERKRANTGHGFGLVPQPQRPCGLHRQMLAH